MPSDKLGQKLLEKEDPYRLRRDAITSELSAHQVGRAIFHLNQRRGFKSNRKTDKTQKEDGAIKQAAANLEHGMGNKTLGAFFAAKHLSASFDERQEAIRAELKKRGKDHLTGKKRKKAWAKARKFLFGDEVLPPQDAPDGVRARATITGTKASYEYYPTRDMLEKEFDLIWDMQAKHHPDLMTDAARHQIRDEIIFFQRELKPAVVGKCTLDPSKTTMDKDPEGYRAPWWHPLAQRFRILQEVRNLEVREANGKPRRLTKEEGDKVVLALLGQKSLPFDRMRTLLKLTPDAKFNLESDKRTKLDGDQTAARLSDIKGFGKAWRGFSLDRQIAIVEKLEDTEDENELINWLCDHCGVKSDAAAHIADTTLPDGHCRYGLRVIRKINPIMETTLSGDGVSGVRMYEAAKLADPDYDPAQQPDGVLSDTGYLPYYGEWLKDDVVGTADPLDPPEKRFGKFPNPTVHIGLGQVHLVVNALIRKFGAPEEISIEFTRALTMSPRDKADKQRDQANNQRDNERRAGKIREVKNNEHYEPTRDDLLRMKLWEELGAYDSVDRKCPYTGDPISVSLLLSANVEVDHILPFSMTWDDSNSNKTVCMQRANRFKKKKTPFQAFGSSPQSYDWDAILQRAMLLPKSKRWRFDEDAHEKFRERGGFQARQLNETGWLARLTKKYLAAVANPYKIRVIPGRLTSMIRGKWGLNSLLPDHNYIGVKDKIHEFKAAMDDLEFAGVKNRADHRHHAIDAFVVALTDPSLLQRMAHSYDDERDKIEIPTPWDKEQLRSELGAVLRRIIVSHRADHGIQGRLHEDTAYGLVKNPEAEGGKHFVRRKAIEGLSAKEVGNIRDPHLRLLVQNHVAAEKAKGLDLKAALESFKTIEGEPHIKHGVQTVRVLVPEDPAYTVTIQSRQNGRPYKAYAAGENLFVDISENAKGKWIGHAVTRFSANQSEIQPMPFDGEGTPVMRIFKGDLISLELNGVRTVMIVRQLDASNNRFKLAAHNETGNLQARHETDSEIDPFRWLMASYNTLKSMKAEKVRVDELGRVWRVSPPAR